jgi:uncharacterized protein YneF (UPF0154 family)
MSWNSIWMGLVLLGCTGLGMLLGAWFAARGFEKSLISTLDDPAAPWNKKEENEDH